MQVRIATAPGTWGVESAGDPANPPWRTVLSEIAGVGFEGTELGPHGYLPERSGPLRDELDARSLCLVAGFVMEPFHDPRSHARILEVARRTCALLRDAGAARVVLIEALAPERLPWAGRSAAPRLDGARWQGMVAAIEEVGRVAAQHDLQATFHPHAGTYVEFADEVERLMGELDDDIGLCVDTGHCAYAGIDPVDLLRAHGERVRHLHLKDVRADQLARCLAGGLAFTDAVAAGVFSPLGVGDVDFVATRNALMEIDYQGWATMEQDRRPGDPRARADAAASLDHLCRVGIASSTPTLRSST